MENCDEKKDCNGRREFLVKTSALAGGLLLTLSGASVVKAQDKAEEITLKLDDKSSLSKVGGSQTVESKGGKVIVVRLSETSFKAFSAKCPHSGGPIEFDAKSNQLSCPWHGSKFDTEGKKLSGPSKKDLSVYSTQNAIVVKL
jgi:nitrite reductase/ring-hydroxylating ferredoxin subunit